MRNPFRLGLALACSGLALGLSASQLFNLLLLLAARAGAGSLGGSLLAGGALQLLTFQLVFDFGGVCHE